MLKLHSRIKLLSNVSIASLNFSMWELFLNVSFYSLFQVSLFEIITFMIVETKLSRSLLSRPYEVRNSNLWVILIVIFRAYGLPMHLKWFRSFKMPIYFLLWKWQNRLRSFRRLNDRCKRKIVFFRFENSGGQVFHKIDLCFQICHNLRPWTHLCIFGFCTKGGLKTILWLGDVKKYLLKNVSKLCT